MIELYHCKPRKAFSYLSDALDAGCVPMLKGSPGIGKSALYRKYCRQNNLHMIDHRLSTSAPEDMTGLPEFKDTPYGRRATFVPFDLFPLEGQPLPEGKDGWVVFLDEFNSATKMVQAAAYKIILDYMVGQLHLHEKVRLGTAGNLMTDRAITNSLSTAMQSRLIHIVMEHDFDQWLLDVALPEKYDERIIAFLSYNHSVIGGDTADALMDFKPDHQEETFACPRTWEFMDRMIRGKEVTDEKTGLYAGTISSTWAAAFVQFCRIYGSLITIKEVLADPTGCTIEFDPERRWAVTSHLMNKVTEENFSSVATYMSRTDLSSRILFFRGMVRQQPTLRQHPAYIRALVELAEYLKED